jgi:TPR repeat protein
MKIRVNNEMVLLGVCAVVLLIASTSDWPYFVYVLLRVLICTVSAYLATKRYTEHNIPWTWAFAAVALLFNPVMPARMARSDWQVVNILCAVFFIVWLVYSKTDWIAIRLGLGSFTTQIRLAAERGDAKAQNNLGLLYDSGKGVPQDYAQAAVWFRRAADQGYSNAQFNLASLYWNGQGVPKDFSLSAFWYQKAADQGEPEAQVRLGALYADGRGVPQDYTQAIAWYRKAADNGYAAAQTRLGVLYDGGRGAPQDPTQAASWYRKAADQDYAPAQVRLGVLYSNGQGVPQDYAEAANWFRRRRSKVMEKLNSILAPYVVTGKECHGTAKKEMSGTAKLKSRATAMAQLESADSSSSGLACGRMAHGTYFANRPES